MKQLKFLFVALLAVCIFVWSQSLANVAESNSTPMQNYVILLLLTVCTISILFSYLYDRYYIRKGLRKGYAFNVGSVRQVIRYDIAGDLYLGIWRLTYLTIDRDGTIIYAAYNTTLTDKEKTKEYKDKYAYYNVYTQLLVLPTGKIVKRQK